MRKKILLLLLIFWLIVIFLFSNMNGKSSRNMSEGLIEVNITNTVEITNRIGLTKYDINQKNRIKKLTKKLNYPIRKCMHALEYFILAIIVYNLFIEYEVDKDKIFMLVILFCFLYACGDEYHQLFRERTSHFSDVCLDTFGGFLGVFISEIKKKFKY